MVALRCQLRKFVANTLILRQEDMPRSVYFIKAGRIKLLKKVEFKIPQTNSEAENIKELTRDPTVQEYDRGLVESKLLEIDELSCGDCFAEYATILREAIQYSVITAIPSEIYSLDIDDFALLGKDFAESFLMFSKLVPADRDLRRAYIEMSRWNQFKVGMTQSVKAEQLNKQKTQEQQLRKPQQIPMKLNMINGNTVGTSSKQSEDSQLKPNYLSTFDYIVKEKKQKQVELSQKQAKKSYLQGFK